MPKSNANDQLDVRCAQCNYELRGITQPVCPECGKDYKSIKTMMAECGKIRRENASDRFVFRCVLHGSAISNMIGMALVLNHYWLACLGNTWPPDPRTIGLFSLPNIGSLIYELATLTWMCTSAVTIIAIAAFAQVFRLGAVGRKWSSLRCSDWCSIGIVLISLIVQIMAQGVTKWLFD